MHYSKKQISTALKISINTLNKYIQSKKATSKDYIKENKTKKYKLSYIKQILIINNRLELISSLENISKLDTSALDTTKTKKPSLENNLNTVLIESLENQLKQKDKQIEILTRLLENQQTLLKNQQTLALTSQSQKGFLGRFFGSFIKK